MGHLKLNVTRMLKRGYSVNSLFALIFMLLSVSCVTVLLISTLKLPEASPRSKISLWRSSRFSGRSVEEESLGELGEMMVGMLADDLPFTIFIPSAQAFERDLKMQATGSLVAEKANDTHAVLSRIVGFSSIPQHLTSVMVPIGEYISFDSVSGFKLQVTRISGKKLSVNGVQSDRVDHRRGEIVVHIMSGVIMDAEFEQSMRPDDDEED